MDIRKLLGKGLLPEKCERDLLNNFKSACPPEARNVAAFRVISNSLHLTEEVVRDRMFAMTVEADLSDQDKRLFRSYDSLLNFQMMDPAERSKILGHYPLARESENRGSTILETTPMAFDEYEQRNMSVAPDQNGNHQPHRKLSTENPGVDGQRKSSILKTVFRRPSGGTTIPRRPSQMQLKSCFVKLVRLSDIQARIASLPRVVKEPPPEKIKPRKDQRLPELNYKRQSHPGEANPRKRPLWNTLIQKQQPLTPALVGSDNSPKPVAVQKSETGNTHPPAVSTNMTQELFVETKTVATAEVELPKVPNHNKTVTSDSPSLKSPTPKVQEFSIFDCTHTPKKPHKRPLIYDEQYRRRLSSITSDDEKLTTAVVSALLSPPLTHSSPNITAALEQPPRRIMDPTNYNGKKKLKTLSKLNSKYHQEKGIDDGHDFEGSVKQQRKPTNWRKSSDHSRNSYSRAKIVDAKQNGKFLLQNDSMSKPLQKFRIPAVAHNHKPPEGSEPVGFRRESYHCHWDKFQERKKSMEDRFGNQLYFRGEKWYTQGEVAPWRKLSKHDLQIHYPQNPGPTHGNSVYFGSKSPEQCHPSSAGPFFTFSNGKTAINSTELTTFNLISDAINQDSASSPTEVMYPVHGVDFPSPNGTDSSSMSQTEYTSRVGTTLTAEVYLNHHPEINSYTTSMYIDDAVSFYEVFSS